MRVCDYDVCTNASSVLRQWGSHC